MNELDHYLKDNLKLKYYIRYMDDFVILVKDKYEARYIYDLVEIFVNNKLGLSLNKKSCYYPSGLGCDFCGYIIFEDYILVRKSSIKKIKRRIKEWNYLYDIGDFDEKSFILSFNSFLGHLNHANAFLLKCSLVNDIKYFNKND